MSDEIIDLSEYLAEREESRAFSVVGGEGERSRLALPVWRAIYLLEGERGGIVWSEGTDGPLRSYFVLDLAESPARTEFEGDGARRLVGDDPPAVDMADGAATILLSRDDRRRWFLLVTGPKVGYSELGRREREDLLFLSGECAGLLLHRRLGEG
ncbi:MAG: hypothetical protein R3223_07540 [Longimicrobiales bacterium]|nr:hypothetical protein [Longimicrobiales bacterium]